MSVSRDQDLSHEVSHNQPIPVSIIPQTKKIETQLCSKTFNFESAHAVLSAQKFHLLTPCDIYLQTIRIFNVGILSILFFAQIIIIFAIFNFKNHICNVILFYLPIYFLLNAELH